MSRLSLPRLDPQRDYFMVPNCVFNLGLSKGALAVYLVLLFREDRKTFTCFPSYEDIGRHIGVRSKTTVAAHVRELEEKGLIRTEPRTVEKKNAKPGNSSLLYHIRPINSAVADHLQLKLSEMESACRQQEALRKLDKKHGHRAAVQPPQGDFRGAVGRGHG